jgi:multidrug efflux pump subunit AcrA (membrane-fusion protein)
MDAEFRGPSTWFPRSHRAAQRRQLEQLRDTFSHAQAAFDDYRVRRPRIGPPDPEGTSPAPRVDAPDPPPIAAMGSAPQNLPSPSVVESTLADVPASPPARAGAAGSSRPRHWRYLIAVILTASIASLGVAHFTLKGGASAIEVAGLDGTAFEATIQPTTTFTIAAPSATLVKQVLVSVGDKVDIGQPLLITDDRDADAARNAAALDLRAADARVDDVRRRLAVVNRTPVEDVARASAKLTTAERDMSQVPTRQWRDSPERAQAAYDQVRSRADRMQKLSDQGLISRQELEDAQIAVRVAADDLANARRAAVAGTSLRSAQSEETVIQLQVARATREQQRTGLLGELQAAQVLREQAEYRLTSADDRIKASTVTASTAGVVVEVPAHQGDQVYAGAPLARVAVLDVMLAEVQVAASLINALRPGAAARVRLPGLPPTDTRGTIATVNPIPNRNGNHVVAVRFDNRAGRLLAGQVAEVRFTLP